MNNWFMGMSKSKEGVQQTAGKQAGRQTGLFNEQKWLLKSSDTKRGKRQRLGAGKWGGNEQKQKCFTASVYTCAWVMGFSRDIKRDNKHYESISTPVSVGHGALSSKSPNKS
jgi:hypothetical protein